MLLYISGSYPDNQEGIASGAKVFLDAMLRFIKKEDVRLLTTDVPVISERIEENSTVCYDLMPDWHVNKRNIDRLYGILDRHDITVIHMEYPGDLYGKTFLASFIPLLVRRYNRKKRKNIHTNIRLHEFSRARFLRKIAIIPLLLWADAIYVPAKKDREIVSHFAGNRVHPTYIGTNISVTDTTTRPPADKTVISYFGSVYPGKGIEYMLDIWKKIKQLGKEGRYSFKIIGDVGTEPTNHFADYHKQVWKWIEQYGLKESIEVTGYLSDEEVSREIMGSHMATLFYEDGLTLRRGSFLAYLAHGIPIITSYGDAEALEIFGGHSGIAMTSTDDEIIRKVREYSALSDDEINRIRIDNIELSHSFDWNNIVEGYLRDYELI